MVRTCGLILNDVTVPIAMLNANGPNAAVFSDLAYPAATRYADLFVLEPNTSPITGALNCVGLSAIQAALGQDFAIAGWIPGPPPNGGGATGNSYLFRFSPDPNGVILSIDYTTDPIATTTATQDVTATYGPNTVTRQATLTPGLGCPLKGRTISFYLDNQFVGSAATDATGKATLAPVWVGNLNAGPHQIREPYRVCRR